LERQRESLTDFKELAVAVDQAKLEAFMGKFLGDLGAVMHAATVVIGESLKKAGTWMIVEPFANDQLEDNLNAVGRVFYSASRFICTPASRSQEVGWCLGAQAGETRIRAVVREGGFCRFRRAAQAPFNLIYEARA
jgi:hypothetical protein